jgi:hypothetical protein
MSKFVQDGVAKLGKIFFNGEYWFTDSHDSGLHTYVTCTSGEPPTDPDLHPLQGRSIPGESPSNLLEDAICLLQ